LFSFLFWSILTLRTWKAKGEYLWQSKKAPFSLKHFWNKH
jgi:hypothetical protein